MSNDPLTDPLLSDVPEVDGFKVLEPCVLHSTLGKGGMGTVYRGRHQNLGVDVAIKCLKPELAREDQQFVARFQREARAAAQLTHSNVVHVYDVRECSGVHYLVMEFVEGENVRERVKRRGPLPVGEALQIAHGAARGLAAAHRTGMVHRDIKPDNILISRDGVVKVADLGLAKPGDGQAGMTRSNVVMGTPQYMPPEQWKGVKHVGPQADVWALGATIYFMLTGRHAIGGKKFSEVHLQVTSKPFPDVRAVRPEAGPELAAVLDRCTRSDPAERYADCSELVVALDELLRAPGASADGDDGAITVERTALVLSLIHI